MIVGPLVFLPAKQIFWLRTAMEGRVIMIFRGPRA